MTYCVISTPEVVCEPQDAKKLITYHNVRILLGQNLYSVAQLDLKVLIGDPEHNISEHVCESLTERGVLQRTPVLAANGRQQEHDVLGPLYSYRWADAPFAVLSVEELDALAWDLRYHPMFAHVTMVADEEEEILPVSDDEVEHQLSDEDVACY